MGDGIRVERGVLELLACAAHMANRSYCRGLGDESQPIWSDAPLWQQDSVRRGVIAALNPDQTPEVSHENWLAQKQAEGWTWGPVKDVDARQHPCMLPYDQLPAEQRAKDQLFLDTVREVARALGVLP